LTFFDFDFKEEVTGRNENEGGEGRRPDFVISIC
jgi:hypothetical protein